jgi:hypothetical protein
MKAVKKLFAALLLGASALTSVQAQSYMFDNPENHTYFGVRVGLDVSSAANGGPLYSSKAGFSIGAIYNIPIVANLYFEPGLHLFYNVFGTSFYNSYEVANPNYDLSNPNEGPTKDVYYMVNGTVRNLGFRIPLNVGYHFDFSDDISVSVYTGPQLNLSYLAHYHQNSYINPETMQTVDGESESIFGTGGFKHFDVQWNFGVGLNYQQYYLGLGGSVGVTKMMTSWTMANEKSNLRRNLFTISLGYNF